jgi:glucuronate isomerase
VSGAASLGEHLVAAIGARDFDAIRACLAPDVRFRALIPDRLREHGTAEDAVERLRQHAYADVRDGRVADLSILCSGFRPVAS